MCFTGLNEFEIIRSEENKKGDITYYLKPIRYKSICPSCNKQTYHIHDSTKRVVRDISSSGHRIDLVIEGHRYKCLNCGKVYSEVYKDIDTKSRLTNRLRRQIEIDCFEKPFSQIAEECFISEAAVRKVFSACIERFNKGHIYKTPAVLGINEVYLNKTTRGVFNDIEKSLVLEIIPEYSNQTIIEFLRLLPNNQQIKIVIMDMHRSYFDAVHRFLPYAAIVIDKYYVVQMIVNTLEKIRMEYKATLSKTERNQLTHEREVLIKSHENLTPQELDKLAIWFNKFSILATAYRLKESFMGIYSANNKTQAVQAYNEWKNSIPQEMKAYKEVCKTIDQWHAEIFNYFDYPYIKIYTECNNNLIKSIEKTGAGRSFEVLRANILYNTAAANQPK